MSDIKEYIKNVKIDDEIIQIKYSEFKNKDKLFDESFNLWDKITMYFYRIKNKVRNVYWEIRYGFQRMFKGYDSVDIFDTFDKFIERYTRILTRFKKNHYGYPASLSEEEWDNILDKMIYHLHYMDEDNVINELTKNLPEDCWWESDKSVSEIMEKHKDEFFNMFSEYFYNLWD